MDKEEFADEMYSFMNETGQARNFLNWLEERGFGDLEENLEEVFEN